MDLLCYTKYFPCWQEIRSKDKDPLLNAVCGRFLSNFTAQYMKLDIESEFVQIKRHFCINRRILMHLKILCPLLTSFANNGKSLYNFGDP